MLNLQVIVASTRDARKGPVVATWFMKQACAHGKFHVELVDLAEMNLPLFDEPRHLKREALSLDFRSTVRVKKQTGLLKFAALETR